MESLTAMEEFSAITGLKGESMFLIPQGIFTMFSINETKFISFHFRTEDILFEVDITVIDILSIDENDLTFSLFFFMRIKYYHPDLFFHFLNSHYRNNSVPWMVTDQFLVPTPTVQLLYVKDNQHNEKKRKLFVKRLGRPYMNGSKEEYKGSENPLILESLNQANLICSLDNVVNYPFGEETCSFRMFLVNDLGQLKAGEISYQGKNILGQFDIFEENWNLKCDEST